MNLVYHKFEYVQNLKSMNSGRGGTRKNAGRKANWNHSETQAIRVPKVFVDELLALARQLDTGEARQSMIMPDLDTVAHQVLNDPQVTRNGKDKGAVRRTLEAVVKYYQNNS